MRPLNQPAMTGPITMSAKTMKSRIKPSLASSDMWCSGQAPAASMRCNHMLDR
jgi:hypothetical protein